MVIVYSHFYFQIPVQLKKIKYRNYDPSHLREANISVLQNRTSVNREAQKFGVPITTLKDRIRGWVDIAVPSSELCHSFQEARKQSWQIM